MIFGKSKSDISLKFLIEIINHKNNFQKLVIISKKYINNFYENNDMKYHLKSEKIIIFSHHKNTTRIYMNHVSEIWDSNQSQDINKYFEYSMFILNIKNKYE